MSKTKKEAQPEEEVQIEGDDAQEDVGPKMEEVPLSETQKGLLIKRHRRYQEALEAANREQETISDFCSAVAGRAGWEFDPGKEGRDPRLLRPVDPREKDDETEA